MVGGIMIAECGREMSQGITEGKSARESLSYSVTVSHYPGRLEVQSTGPVLLMRLRMMLNSEPSGLHFLSARIIGYHT